jgi:hypothetical protein
MTKDFDAEYLPKGKLAKRYGVSTMSVTRWVRDPELGFPKPNIVNDREYFHVPATDRWMQSRPTSKTAKAGA